MVGADIYIHWWVERENNYTKLSCLKEKAEIICWLSSKLVSISYFYVLKSMQRMIRKFLLTMGKFYSVNSRVQEIIASMRLKMSELIKMINSPSWRY